MADRDSVRRLQFCAEDANPTHFFYEKIQEAQGRQKIKLTENVEFYLVNLLVDFVQLRGDSENDCLALLLKKALESSREEQVIIFKKLADTALYFSGFFQEYFNNKSFDVGYYVTMGEAAYGQLASIMRKRTTSESTLSEIYSDMSKNFSKSVDILLDVSEHTAYAQGRQRDTLSIYDAWLSTQSEKLHGELKSRGIHPILIDKKNIQ